mgnify:CR=1 FL=1
MTPTNHKHIVSAAFNQINKAKDDYKSGRINRDTLQYVKERMDHIIAQAGLEYKKDN